MPAGGAGGTPARTRPTAWLCHDGPFSGSEILEDRDWRDAVDASARPQPELASGNDRNGVVS